MNVVNLTPHSITFVIGEEKKVVEPSGTIARCAVKTVKTGEIDGIPVTESEFGEVEGLPPEKEGTIYIVSSLVAGRVIKRKDVFIPNESVRDGEGRIIGCKSLGRVC